VLNVVTGPGDPAGQALIQPDGGQSSISFTGSRAVGQKVMTAAAAVQRPASSSAAEPVGGVRRRRHRHRRRGDDGLVTGLSGRSVRGADQGTGAPGREWEEFLAPRPS
jgi:hypothetical protein